MAVIAGWLKDALQMLNRMILVANEDQGGLGNEYGWQGEAKRLKPEI
jgi:hypothetical protein